MLLPLAPSAASEDRYLDAERNLPVLRHSIPWSISCNILSFTIFLLNFLGRRTSPQFAYQSSKDAYVRLRAAN